MCKQYTNIIILEEENDGDFVFVWDHRHVPIFADLFLGTPLWC